MAKCNQLISLPFKGLKVKIFDTVNHIFLHIPTIGFDFETIRAKRCEGNELVQADWCAHISVYLRNAINRIVFL